MERHRSRSLRIGKGVRSSIGVSSYELEVMSQLLVMSY